MDANAAREARIARETRPLPRASVIIPTLNEAENLEPLALRLATALPSVEMVIVDDGSTDGTSARARALGERFDVRLIERVGERGLSTAALRGIAEARSPICVVMDADLSHPPEAVAALVEAVESGASMSIGSRYVPGGAIDGWPRWRRFTSWAGTLLARPLTSVRDPMAGFFCLRKSLLEGVELKPRGFKILLEILARARPGRVVEIPIRFEDREEGRSKFDARQRREYLKQVWTLYRDTRSWPWIATLVAGAAALAAAGLWLLRRPGS